MARYSRSASRFGGQRETQVRQRAARIRGDAVLEGVHRAAVAEHALEHLVDDVRRVPQGLAVDRADLALLAEPAARVADDPGGLVLLPQEKGVVDQRPLP